MPRKVVAEDILSFFSEKIRLDILSELSASRKWLDISGSHEISGLIFSENLERNKNNFICCLCDSLFILPEGNRFPFYKDLMQSMQI